MDKILRISGGGPTVAQSHGRIGWVDNAKALGIFLVVFAHTSCQGAFCDNLIFCFHMPLFFFLSGYLLKEKYLADKFRAFLWRTFRLLIIPYISFWAMAFGYRMVTYSLRSQLVHGEKVSYADHIYGFIFGIHETLAITNGPLWFLTCLFCTMILFYWLSKIRKAGLFLSLLALLGLIGPMIHKYMEWRLPWNLELSFVAVGFYGIGYIVSKSVTLKATKNAAHQLFTLAILVVLLTIAAKINGRVSMAKMRFGNLLLFYLGAFSGIGLIVLLSHMIRNNACFEWLSRNTIVILATHIITFTAFKGLSMMFLNMNRHNTNLGIGLLYTTGALAICYPISYIIDKYFPWMVGHRVLLTCKQNPFHMKVSKIFL